MTSRDSNDFAPDVEVRESGLRIGAIGAGMIMSEMHLEAYRLSGFPVVAIASRTPSRARAIADRYGIPTVHGTPAELIADPNVDIVDIAFPPDQQPGLIRAALAQQHVKGILAQKPLALTLEDAVALRNEAAAAGKVLSVNQNMRFDQSIRVLKQILDREELGQVVFASITMHAIPHWQSFLEDYDRLTLANMSVHHLDTLRYLFGEPEEIHTVTRSDPRTTFAHSDGIVVSTLTFPSGMLALSVEDVWSGPREVGYESDASITWRVEGVDGVAKGTIGWPTAEPSTLTYASTRTTDGKWVSPSWETQWFPHAFIGVMEQLQYALANDTAPELTVEDNVRTIALIEAGYLSIDENRPVRIAEIAI